MAINKKTTVKPKAPKVKAKPKKAKKKMPGKSIASAMPIAAVYKPTLYLENGQISANMDKAKIGDKVNITIEAKVVSRAERESRSGKNKEISLEVQKVK